MCNIFGRQKSLLASGGQLSFLPLFGVLLNFKNNLNVGIEFWEGSIGALGPTFETAFHRKKVTLALRCKFCTEISENDQTGAGSQKPRV